MVYSLAMFKPEEIIFAPTAQCNLQCSHCRVSRLPESLDAGRAIAFMGSCAEKGIELVGFSGGEPFIRPDFLVEVSREAVALDLRFDRLMTNGLWWRDGEELKATLGRLCDAGFDGTFGLSVDSYHGRRTDRLATFIDAVFAAWGRRDCVEILAVEGPDEAGDLAQLEDLAGLLPGSLVMDGKEARGIVNARELARDGSGEDDREALRIDIHRSSRSASADEDAWTDEAWFVDDFCEGPGNVFFVHPDGRVASCCGFANEREALIIGDIGAGKKADGYDELMKRAGANRHLHSCYVKGLATRRREIEASGSVFHGRTRDICFFCDWMCAQGIE